MADTSSPLTDPDRPRHRLPAAVVRVGHLRTIAVGLFLLLLTAAGAVALGTGGRASRLVSDTAPGGAPALTGTAAPGQIIALTDRGVVALDAQTGAERRLLAGIRKGTGQGISVSPDARSAYFAVVDGDAGTISVVDTAGASPPAFVATGSFPAVSPDGRQLAYVTPVDTIAVLDLETGARRTWAFAEDDPAGNWLLQARLLGLAWAPDSQRLAFTVSYEGDTIAVLDTATAATLSEATEVVVPGGGGDSRHPTWQSTTGQLVVVNRAFECCFEDDYSGPPRVVAVDLVRDTTTETFRSGVTPSWLDFDRTGHHLLSVDDGRLYRRSHGGAPVELATGVQAADW
jgi:Tol biopolymer transport system component